MEKESLIVMSSSKLGSLYVANYRKQLKWMLTKRENIRCKNAQAGRFIRVMIMPKFLSHNIMSSTNVIRVQ